MSWRTDGKARLTGRFDNNGRPTKVTNKSRHARTGAASMREHRAAKRTQAEARNALTPPERRRKTRSAPIG